MHVVILAAGMGTRLGSDAPKPLAEIAPGRTLLSHQVQTLGRLVDHACVHPMRVVLVALALRMRCVAQCVLETVPDCAGGDYSLPLLRPCEAEGGWARDATHGYGPESIN